MVEYNPKNEVLKKQYEEVLLHGKHRDPKTVKAVWNNLNLFEEFTHQADFQSFNAEQAKGYKIWLEKQENKQGKLLSLSTVKSCLSNVREFFEWLSVHPQYIKKVDGRAVQYLHLSNNHNRAARASREKPAPSLGELKKVLKAMPCDTEIEKRDRAVFAFMVITCVRDDALISLKRVHVKADEKTVWQDPKVVRTKLGKGILTRFVGSALPLAEEIVLDWLSYIDEELKFKPDDPLFPKTLVEVNAESLSFEVSGLSREHWAGAGPVRDIFKAAFKSVGLPYYNPHLFRKTICKWGLKNLSQYEFKALSQNLGHEHAMTTYNSYAKLSEDEQLEAVSGIGNANTNLQYATTAEILAEMARRVGK